MLDLVSAKHDLLQSRREVTVEIDRSRDALLTEFGKAVLDDRYLLPDEDYQDLFARVSSHYGDDSAHAQRLYDYMSRLWFMPSTPVLSNGGTDRGLPISCFLNEASDSLHGIVDLWNENVWLAARGGGIGSYWGNLRSIGEKVSANGKTSGIIPFIRVMDSLTLAISQGSLRRGSAAVYIGIDHPEIEEFIEIRRPTGGDPNRKALNLHHGVVITDAFMRAVENGEEWALISPKDKTVVRRIEARSLWIRLLTSRVETGEPYFIFIDHVNRAAPEHHKLAGLQVRMSNLCSEITLPTGPDHHGEERTAVCCLSSLNLETYLEWRSDPLFIEDVMRFLDNVLEDFIGKAPASMERARYAAMRERSVGLGVMGFHSFLQSQNVPIESAAAKAWEPQYLPPRQGPCRRRVEDARRRARTVPGRRRLRVRRALFQQARHRADRLDLDHLRRLLAGYRAQRRQRLHPQDPVGLVQRSQQVPEGSPGGEGARHRRRLDLDHRQRGLGRPSRLPERRREGHLQDRVRGRPALAGRFRRRPCAVRLPVAVPQRVPAGRRAQEDAARHPLPGPGRRA